MANRVVVTGGSGGLGEAFCAAFGDRGDEVVPVDVVGTDRRLDVTDPGACRRLAEDVKPDIWVNNAGVTGAGELLDQQDDQIQRIVAVNFLGVVNGTRAAARAMLDRGGVILNVASLAGWAPTPHIAVYSGTKHAVRAFSVAAAAELRHTPVRVKCLLPDGIRTPMVHVDDPRHLMSFTGKRLLEPAEVVAAGLALLTSKRVLASVPPTRGLTVRLLGIWPGLASALQSTVEARARRNQATAQAGSSEAPPTGSTQPP
ncbi:MAG: putative oxidoreductase EphD [Acidimicrobiales bacterium]|nr:MAG: SDR family oxidoreductase [Actinomycetota bacterium]MBV6509025.1 putative oxidoreductase EphD [Acidimicrobiales bacterium]RIK06263.1 MAG: short-chain dehydrogenase [Acidobacteriota bacterium]